MTSCSSFSGGNACQSADASALAPRVADKVARTPATPAAGTTVSPGCIFRSLRPAICSATTATVNSTAAMSPARGVFDAADPEQAVLKVRRWLAIPQLSVVGIAGPGDPLANMTRTFRTLELVRDQLPDLKLCLSTNGLMLPDAVDRLLEVGVDHVTVTINTLDADIAGQIYAWLWLDGERYCGPGSRGDLIARQLEESAG